MWRTCLAMSSGGPPSANLSLRGSPRWSCAVTLLGRRIADEDAQAQLDALGDELLKVLGGSKNRQVNSLFLRCTSLDPGTVFVAGVEIPAYVATVDTEDLTC